MTHTLSAMRRSGTTMVGTPGEGRGAHTAESALLVGLISVAAAIPLMAFGRSLRSVLAHPDHDRAPQSPETQVHCLCHHTDVQARSAVRADPYMP